MKLLYRHRDQLDLMRIHEIIGQHADILPYHYPWYLDIVSSEWGALITESYDGFMPLPFHRRWLGWRQIHTPLFCQRVGWIAASGAKAPLWEDIIAAIPTIFFKVDLSLDHLEQITYPSRRRLNLVLPLGQGYDHIYQGYQKTLKKRLRRAGRSGYTVLRDFIKPDQLVQHYRGMLVTKVNLPDRAYLTVLRLMQESLSRSLGGIYSAHDIDGNLLAASFFLITQTRIINLFGVSTVSGRAGDGMHFLLDRVIDKYATTPMIFDFEGSELPGVATFFSSFGASQEWYTHVTLDRHPVLSRLGSSAIKLIRRRYF